MLALYYVCTTVTSITGRKFIRQGKKETMHSAQTVKGGGGGGGGGGGTGGGSGGGSGGGGDY